MVKKYLLVLVFLGLAVFPGAQSLKGFPGLYRFQLENGLEVFVFENSNVPLARIQLNFRCGALSQTPTTAGLFHLYEHMVFKGNDAYPDEGAFGAAMTGLGVSQWNGGTSREYVNYYFTVPADKTAQGIEFWAQAVKNPKLDPKDLELEKDVVLNEIRGYFADPQNVFYMALTGKVFSTYPWRKDVSGSEKNIKNATIADLREIQSRYYIPSNAALFVAGAVKAADVEKWAKAAFGPWKGTKTYPPTPPAHPFPKVQSQIVFGDESIPQGIPTVIVQLRGPDVLADPESTYAADVWLTLCDRPGGRFKKAIMEKVPSIYKESSINVHYYTQRDGGTITLSASLGLKPGMSADDEAKKLEKAFREEFMLQATDPNYFSDEDFDLVKTILADRGLYERETAEGFVGTLSFWWSSANTEYYLGYLDNFRKVGRKDLKRYLDIYLTKPGVIALNLNSQDWKDLKTSKVLKDWEEVTNENAYWWK